MGRVREGAASVKLKKASLFTKVVILALAIYAVTSLVTIRGRITAAEENRLQLQQKVTEMSQSNAGLEYQIEHGADDETIEDIARNKLGLVYPGEKIFYDISD